MNVIEFNFSWDYLLKPLSCLKFYVTGAYLGGGSSYLTQFPAQQPLETSFSRKDCMALAEQIKTSKLENLKS